MPILSIAFMAIFAFSGTSEVPVSAPTTEISEQAVDNTTLALKTSAAITRTSADDAETFSVLLTSYNAVPEQTDGNPLVTASGAFSNPEVIAAVSKDLKAAMPFGTIIEISRTAKDTERCHFAKVEPLIGYRVIADSMHSRKTNQVDVLLDASDTVTVNGKAINPSVALGMCSDVSIRVVGRIKVSDIPATQEELRLMVEGDALAFNK
jgi:3D (Asp-Asp-Asp) domain-containing protein